MTAYLTKVKSFPNIVTQLTPKSPHLLCNTVGVWSGLYLSKFVLFNWITDGIYKYSSTQRKLDDLCNRKTIWFENRIKQQYLSTYDKTSWLCNETQCISALSSDIINHQYGCEHLCGLLSLQSKYKDVVLFHQNTAKIYITPTVCYLLHRSYLRNISRINTFAKAKVNF